MPDWKSLRRGDKVELRGVDDTRTTLWVNNQESGLIGWYSANPYPYMSLEVARLLVIEESSVIKKIYDRETNTHREE